MSATALITAMENLLKLHKSLNELAIKKTDIIKAGDMPALDQMLKDEQSHVAAIEKMEQLRQAACSKVVQQEKPTLEDCLPLLEEDIKSKALTLKDSLVKEVEALQERNQLNQQLIYQSLQFVNMSMSLLQPQSVQNFNYTNPKSNQFKPQKGMFNSRA
ncbi:flagellar protein FlgN [Cytobacillus gottheilii]|uniref:Flagellar protein FlgN n=1 Tax=Cytobacillus gottheilii TaxID=859144 RepID=A0ABX8FCC4_9BACI|nr:flagellar protein FlgN [Cytobacillus gottheilii]QVY61217.1 flagellar protein FlgN [Cytobacillus gottheilii]